MAAESGNKGKGVKSSDANRTPKGKVPFHLSFTVRLRNYFLAGILVTAPISITVYLSWLFINFVDRTITPIIPVKYNPETYLPFGIPGLGLIVLVVALTLVGAITAGYFGRLFVRMSERVLARMPVVRSIYGALKQIFETVLARQSDAFRQVALIEYPRRGIWAIGFLTGATEGEVQRRTDEKMLNVFLPTTPNPTSGFLLFVPREEVVFLDMSVEEGIKMVVSAGIVTPQELAKKAEEGKAAEKEAEAAKEEAEAVES
jgi:uncharacterized membrane protein